MNRYLTPVLTGTIAFTMLVACGSPADRTGADVAPVELKAAHDTAYFQSLSTATADSSVTIVNGQPVDPDPNEDGVILAALSAGDADLAMIRAGRLVKEGASSLAPLQAPFLVSNNEQAIAIASNQGLAEPLMASLDQLGLVGLALVPTGVRHPFGYGEPLRGAGDYDQQTINIRPDAGVEAIVAALGAKADNSVEDERTQAVADGRLRGIEASLQLYGAVDRPAVLTSNVTFYERFDVVIIRKAAWDSLTADQQSELKASAVAARDAAYADMPTEEQVFSEWCNEQGATVVTAGSEALASLHAKLDPITASMADDPDLGQIVSRMAALEAGTTTPTLDCASTQGPAAGPEFEPNGDQSVFDGTWRFNSDEKKLIDAGASAADAHGNAGVWEMTVKDGVAAVTFQGKSGGTFTFTFSGDRVQVDLGEQGGVMEGTYEIDGDTAMFDWNTEDTAYPWVGTLFGEAVRVQQ